MTKEGVKKFIEFSNRVNLGYLLVSGGGEPMLEKQSILKIIEEVESERIVFVTSAHWSPIGAIPYWKPSIPVTDF